jgi:hypothetical protein
MRLVALKQLRELDLAGTDLSDNGLRTLGKLNRLKKLDVSGTCVSKEGVSALQLALPDTAITWTAREGK